MVAHLIRRIQSNGYRFLQTGHFRDLAGLFLVGYVVTLLVMPGTNGPVSDSPARLGVAHWLWTGEAIPGEWLRLNGGNHPWFGLGQSLVLIPFDLVATGLLRMAGVSGDGEPGLRFLVVAYMAFPLINGACTATSYALLRQMRFDRRACIVGTFCLLSCTTLLWHFQNNQENPLHLLLIMAGLCVALSCRREDQRRRLWLAFLVAGFAILIRVTAVVDYAAVFAIAVCANAGFSAPGPTFKQGFRAAVRVATIALPVFVFYLFIDRVYHFARFGELGSTYIHLIGAQMRAINPSLPDSFPFCVPFLEGATGFLSSPAKSIFIYDPLLMVTPVVAVIGRERLNTVVRTSLLAVTVALAGTIAAYATYYCWSGEDSWGARFLSVPTHLLCLVGAAIACSRIPRVRQHALRFVAVPVLALSFSLQVASLVYPSYIELTQTGRHELPWKPTPELIEQQGSHPHVIMRFENILTATGPAHDPRAASARQALWLLPLSPLEEFSPAGRVSIRLTWTFLFAGVLFLAARLLASRST